MIGQRGPLHPSRQPNLIDWQERYRSIIDEHSALQLLPTRGELARRWGTQPMKPVRLVEAEGNYEEALDMYASTFERAYVHRNIIEAIVACKGVFRNLARLDRSSEIPDDSETLFTDVDVTNAQFSRLTDGMANNFWRTEPPIAVEVKEHPWSIRPEVHEVGPFEAKPNLVLATIALHEAGVSLVTA